MLSTFCEHLIDEEIAEAVAQAANAIDASVTDYSVAAVVPRSRRTGPGTNTWSSLPGDRRAPSASPPSAMPSTPISVR